MERVRARLFSRLREYFTSSRATIEMVGKICDFLDQKKPSITSEQLLIETVSMKVDDLRRDFIFTQFPAILKSVSNKVVEGPLSKFFGKGFRVQTKADGGHLPPFNNCLLGNMPKDLFNGEELEFARFLDGKEGLPWLKTVPSFKINFPYPLGTFYPDFIVIPVVPDGKPKTTYYVETKGGHLLKTPDSNFKKFACKEITEFSGGKLTMVFGSFDECKSFFNNR